VVRPTGPQGLVNSGIFEVEGTVAKKSGRNNGFTGRQASIGSYNYSVDIEKLLPAFEQLEKDLSQQLGINLESKARFYETISHISVKTGRNPLEVFSPMRKTIRT
jgi:hypothetical protein